MKPLAKSSLAVLFIAMSAAAVPALAMPAAGVPPRAPEMVGAGSPDVTPAITDPARRQLLRGSALVMHSDDGLTHDHE